MPVKTYVVNGQTFHSLTEIAAHFGNMTHATVSNLLKSGKLEEWLSIRDGRPCATCGKEFKPTSCRHKCCTPECGQEARKETRLCEVCGDEFRTTRSLGTRTCNKGACRARIWRRQPGAEMGGGDPKNVAPQPVRDTYCNRRQMFGPPIRCKTHHETCGEGCLRLDKNGMPCCRVEPGQIPGQVYLQAIRSSRTSYDRAYW